MLDDQQQAWKSSSLEGVKNSFSKKDTSALLDILCEVIRDTLIHKEGIDDPDSTIFAILDEFNHDPKVEEVPNTILDLEKLEHSAKEVLVACVDKSLTCFSDELDACEDKEQHEWTRQVDQCEFTLATLNLCDNDTIQDFMQDFVDEVFDTLT